MSVVAAKVYKDRVVFAADSIICQGSFKRKNYNKLFEWKLSYICESIINYFNKSNYYGCS